MSVRRLLYYAGVPASLLDTVLEYERRILCSLDWNLQTSTLVSGVVGLCNLVGVSGRLQLCCAMFSDYLLLDPQIQSCPLSEVVVAIVRCVYRSLHAVDGSGSDDSCSSSLSSSPRSCSCSRSNSHSDLSSISSSSSSSSISTSHEFEGMSLLESASCSLLCRVYVEKAWSEVEKCICSTTDGLVGDVVGDNWVNWSRVAELSRDTSSSSSSSTSSPTTHQLEETIIQTHLPSFLETIQSRL